ncbi:NAD(P)/FAD-dependent oxidoreductase [Varunaivibrio sulfuroxidans]|nr:NAD(P)/FAD-dependent oxidoreductase [Varunaivibrio sulfuroxidans]
METLECAVVGAGVVGLAVGRALARDGREVVVLEKEDAVGTGISARNSEVIHAGIYYPHGSLKARLCVDGRMMLYDYLHTRHINHEKCGKLIVACRETEDVRLNEIAACARSNGVGDLQKLAQNQVRALEPQLNARAALFSPSTGILDAHAYMLSLQGELENAGGMVALNSPLQRILPTPDGRHLRMDTGGPTPMTIDCRWIVNCAGLDAQHVAASCATLAGEKIPPRYLAKGSYFTLSGRAPFRHLIYPVPQPAGLGVHLTLDLGGQAKFGPDVEWIDTIDYAVDSARAERFYAAIRSYWPDLKDGALHPGYAGIRPKLQAPGTAQRDFMIQGPEDHGVGGLINLYGIESPGLTAALAIAKMIRARIR